MAGEVELFVIFIEKPRPLPRSESLTTPVKGAGKVRTQNLLKLLFTLIETTELLAVLQSRILLCILSVLFTTCVHWLNVNYCLVVSLFALLALTAWWCHRLNCQQLALGRSRWPVLASGIVCQRTLRRHRRCRPSAND